VSGGREGGKGGDCECICIFEDEGGREGGGEGGREGREGWYAPDQIIPRESCVTFGGCNKQRKQQ